MDPLSITTAAITIAGVLRGTAKAVKVARVAYLAEEGLQQITSEVGDISSLLETMTSVLQASPTHRISSVCLEKLSLLLTKTTLLLGRLNDTLQGCLKVATNESEPKHVSKRAWLRKRRAIKELLGQIKEARTNLVAHWNILLAYIATKADSSAGDTQAISSIMNWTLDNLKETVTNGFDEQNAALRDFLAALSPACRSRNYTSTDALLPISKVEVHQSDRSTAITLVSESNSVTVPSTGSKLITVQLPHYGRQKCLKGCKCGCHVQIQQRLFPRPLEAIIGAMFMSYIGVPSVTGRHTKRCRRCTESTIVLTYQFPEWFIAKVVAFKLSSLTTGICASLSMSRVVPASAEVIQCACEGNAIKMASLFTRGMASPDDRSIMNGTSPLTFAIRYNKLEVCQLLLFHGADPMAVEGVSRPIDEAWEKILSGKDPSDGFRFLLGSNDEYLESKGFTLLHKTVLDIVYLDLSQLLGASCADIDQQDADGKSPLAWAALRRDHHSLELLLSFCADTTATCKLGRTVLHYACRGGSSECIQALLSHTDVDTNAVDDNGNTALHFASQLPPHESSPICAILLKAGADVNHRDNNGWNATFWATEHDDAENLRQLTLSGAYIEYRLRSGHTPLTLAVNRNSISCLSVLLDHGADVHARMKNGWDIVHIVAYFGMAECMRVLEEAKCVGLDPERLDHEGKRAEVYLLQRENLTKDLAAAFQRFRESLIPRDSIAERGEV